MGNPSRSHLPPAELSSHREVASEVDEEVGCPFAKLMDENMNCWYFNFLYILFFNLFGCVQVSEAEVVVVAVVEVEDPTLT